MPGFFSGSDGDLDDRPSTNSEIIIVVVLVIQIVIVVVIQIVIVVVIQIVIVVVEVVLLLIVVIIVIEVVLIIVVIEASVVLDRSIQRRTRSSRAASQFKGFFSP